MLSLECAHEIDQPLDGSQGDSVEKAGPASADAAMPGQPDHSGPVGFFQELSQQFW